MENNDRRVYYCLECSIPVEPSIKLYSGAEYTACPKCGRAVNRCLPPSSPVPTEAKRRGPGLCTTATSGRPPSRSGLM